MPASSSTVSQLSLATHTFCPALTGVLTSLAMLVYGPLALA